MRVHEKFFLSSIVMIFFCIAALSLSEVLGDAGDPALITLQRKNIKSSSVLMEKGKPPSYYAADRAVDGKIGTAWCASQNDPGATIELEFTPAPLRTVHVFGGYGANIGLCKHNNRIKNYELTFILTSGKTVIVRGKLNDPCETSFHMDKEFGGSMEEWCKNPCYDKSCPEKDPKKIQECIRTLERGEVKWVGYPQGGVSGIGEISTPNKELLCVKGIKLKVLSVHPGRGSKGTCDTCVSEIVVSPGWTMDDNEFKKFQKKCK
ncbi:MAG TPA: discoidin domain-containing protein [Spirochaetota bacterium]|nr:discoidin domain-containing protein [Spirochaetota bacterium]